MVIRRREHQQVDARRPPDAPLAGRQEDRLARAPGVVVQAHSIEYDANVAEEPALALTGSGVAGAEPERCRLHRALVPAQRLHEMTALASRVPALVRRAGDQALVPERLGA